MKHLSILMVGVALLVGGCVQLQQPLVNGGSKLGANREISIHELELREGVWYAKGETEAFNGTAINYREDGAKSSETPYVEGKKHGTQISYYENGSKHGKNSPTWTARSMARRLVTTRTDRRREKSPTWTAKGMARRLSTARTDRRRKNPSSKTAKRSPSKLF